MLKSVPGCVCARDLRAADQQSVRQQQTVIKQIDISLSMGLLVLLLRCIAQMYHRQMRLSA